MLNIDELEEKFSIEGEVGFANLGNDFIFISVSNKYAEADICLYGAQITNFTPHESIGALWMSSECIFQEGKAIRGGIPVCFPWFGPHKTDTEKPQHGFARIMHWDVNEISNNQIGETIVSLKLCSSGATKALWPHDFCAEINFIIGKSLSVSLKVTNTSTKAFEYTAALHSYFNLSGIENIAIEGLQNTKYNDYLTSTDSVQKSPDLLIEKAETRLYYDTEETCLIKDSAFNRKISVAKKGSSVTTVWNPGEETCRNASDLADDAYQTFVCVEATNTLNNIVNLAPGESHETSTIIGVER